MDELTKRVEAIEKRNKAVELDKAWETSIYRKVSIAGITYVFITLIFFIIKVDRPFVNALVPTTGFILSTLSLSALKNIWLKSKNK